MQTKFYEEFYKADNGFWILNKTQSFMAVGGILVVAGILGVFNLGVLPRIAISVVSGASLGFTLGMKVKGVEAWRKMFAKISFQVRKIINRGEMDLLASQYRIQSSVSNNEDAYRLVNVITSLPKEL